MARKEKSSFLVYHDWKALVSVLPMDQRGELFTALFDYSIDGVIPELDDMPMGVFAFMRLALDRDAKKYQETCERNQRIAQDRWDKEKGGTSAYKRTPEDASAYERMRLDAKSTDNDNDNDKENDKENEKDNDNGNNYGSPVVRISLSSEGIPMDQAVIVDYIEKEYPWLNAKEVAEEVEDSMIRYIENGDDEYIRSWKAFTRKVCQNKEF